MDTDKLIDILADDICRTCHAYKQCKNVTCCTMSFTIAEWLIKYGYIKEVTAEWIENRWSTEDDWGIINHRSITCSNCKTQISNGEKSKYCCHCGARMLNFDK